MPYRSKGYPHRPDSGRIVRSGEARSVPAQAGFTLAHAGRQVRIGPVTFWIVVGSLVVMAGWSLATGTYFAFKDDVLTRLIARQKEQQFAYEDRIAELRAQVDRIASRQLLDQEQFEQRLEQILRRQAVLESRATTLSGMPDPTPTGSIRPRPMPMADPHAGPPPKPAPISDTVIFTPPPDREARLESRVPPATASRSLASVRPHTAGFEGALARLQSSLDRVEARQTSALNALEETFDIKAKHIRSVLGDLGIASKAGDAMAPASGGPYVPLKLRNDTGPFERQLYRVNIARSHVERLTRTLGTVPLRKPIAGNVDLSSNFGVRVDPFLRSPAMHTGIDFRAGTGEPVRATANGRVETAAWNGGYGKMVEIDHGNGYSTRYAHLSEIEVKPRQIVKTGQIVGRVGSTGRSTGPHLHYETRVDGEAVDPQKFLRAGLRLGNVLTPQ
jgi:murein DD-endopeptidase MepM/ murein hydrolase activator NlpD